MLKIKNFIEPYFFDDKETLIRKSDGINSPSGMMH